MDIQSIPDAGKKRESTRSWTKKLKNFFVQPWVIKLAFFVVRLIARELIGSDDLD